MSEQNKCFDIISFTLNELRLEELTSETCKQRCKDTDFEEWGAPFWSFREYERISKLRSDSEFAMNAIYFVLVTPENRHVLCHCEAYSVKCIRRTKSQDRAEGVVVEGISYQIASVYTQKRYRNRGLATHFMKEIAKNLKQRPEVLASALYADIDPVFYERVGWKWREYASKIAILDTGVVEAKPVTRGKALDFDAVESVLETDVRLLKEQLFHDESLRDSEVFVLIPSVKTIKWHHIPSQVYCAREEYKRTAQYCGYFIHDTAFIVWSHDFKESILYILRARLECELHDVMELMYMAIAEAKMYALQYIKIWQPPAALFETTVQQTIPFQKCEQKKSISCLHLFERESLPKPTGKVVWLANEKYGWV